MSVRTPRKAESLSGGEPVQIKRHEALVFKEDAFVRDEDIEVISPS